MKHIRFLLLSTIIGVMGAGCGRMNISSPTPYETKTAAIIRQMPAENIEDTEALAAELVALNPQATMILSKMLLPPTDPNDTAARYGLSAMAHYVARDGRQADRRIYAEALIKSLALVPDRQNKAFLISQLQWVGQEEAIAPLAQYLTDDFLCDYAAGALLTIGGEGVEKAFLNALDAASGAKRVTMIKALGELKSTAAAAKLSGDAESGDFDLRRTALYALANIGDPASQRFLSDACQNDDIYERGRSVSLYLLFARRQAEGGDMDRCAQICTALLQQCSEQSHLRLSAINTLREAIGSDNLCLIRDAALRKQVQDTITAASDESSALQMPEGFVSLFNGRDLAGWKRHDGLPGEDHPTGKWTVEDGVIVGIQDPPGKGGFLSTTESFRDFELLLETKIEWPFDSGVFLRVGPDGKSHQVTLDYRPGGEIGGIYCPWTHGFVHHCPEGISHFRKDQWNHLRIICQGQPARIRVWVNDALVTDFQHTEKTTARIPKEGTICLQVHPGGEGFDKSRAAFRNISIRPLESTSPIDVLTAEEEAEGFVSLFNGRDLTGWVGSKDTYGVKDGVMFCRKSTGHNIYTEKEYSNFILRFEFKLEPGSNNGLGIRTPLVGDAAYVGMELQILDNTAEKYSNLHDWQYHGSVYGVVSAKRGHLKPVGEWNVQEVIADGTHIVVNLNGSTIVDADIKEASANGTIDGKKHPGLLNPTGHIAFLGHGDYVEFRNIRIKEL